MTSLSRLIAVALAAAAVLPAGTLAAPGKTLWWSDLAGAQAEARRTGKPIFLVFRCMP